MKKPKLSIVNSDYHRKEKRKEMLVDILLVIAIIGGIIVSILTIVTF